MAKPEPKTIRADELSQRVNAGAHAHTRARVEEIIMLLKDEGPSDSGIVYVGVCSDWLRLRDEFDALLDGFYTASNLFQRLTMGLRPTPEEWLAASGFFNAATDIGEREENWRRGAAGEAPVKHMRLDQDTGLGPPPEDKNA